MHFFRDLICRSLKDMRGSCVDSALEYSQSTMSSCINHTLRFCVRRLLAFMHMDVLYAGFAGAKTSHKKSLFLKAP